MMAELKSAKRRPRITFARDLSHATYSHNNHHSHPLGAATDSKGSLLLRLTLILHSI